MFKNIKKDLPAGLAVALVALPLCLGVAAASTGESANLFSGILSGIIGGIIVGYFSGSHLGVSGPAAGLILIVLSAINSIGYSSFLLALLIAGLLQVLAGFLKAGIIGHYFPSSVIKGMLAAIGITLILKEIPHILGDDSDFMGEFDFHQMDGLNTFSELGAAFQTLNKGALIISAISILILLILDKPYFKKMSIFKFIPSSLIVVIVGVLINSYFLQSVPLFSRTGEHLVQLPIAKSLTEFLEFFQFPDFTSLGNFKVYEIAFTLFLVASLETLLSVEATDKLDPHKRVTPTNKELKAQGIGNMISGLIGGLPVTQVIVRSSANIQAGGESKLATMIHGLLLLLFVIVIPQWLNMIPMASLAAILLLIGYKLTKISLIKAQYKLGPEQFVPFIGTIIGVVSFDLLKGIGIGLVLAMFYIIKKNYTNSYHYREVETNNQKEIFLKLSEEVTFLNKGSIIQTLNHLPADSIVTIDGSESVNIDYDVSEAIYEFKDYRAKDKNIELILIDIPENEKVSSH